MFAVWELEQGQGSSVLAGLNRSVVVVERPRHHLGLSQLRTSCTRLLQSPLTAPATQPVPDMHAQVLKLSVMGSFT